MLFNLKTIIYKLLATSLVFTVFLSHSTSNAKIVEMTDDANLSHRNTNLTPAFANGDTIKVMKDGLSLRTLSTESCSIDLNGHNMRKVWESNYPIHIGSIANGLLDYLSRHRYNTYIELTGHAGEGRIPQANDYSGVRAFDISNENIIIINAPITLSAYVSSSDFQQDIGSLNINDQVTWLNPVHPRPSPLYDNQYWNTLGDFSNINIRDNSSFTVGVDNVDFSHNINFTGSGGSFTLIGQNQTISGTINFNGSGTRLNINGTGTSITGARLNINGTDTSIIGNQNLQNPIINLGLNQLEFRGDVTTAGTMTLIVKHNDVLDGSIKITDGNLDLSKLDHLRITPIVNINDILDKHYSYKLIAENGGTITPISVKKIIIDDKEQLNRYVNYSVDGDLILHLTDIADEVLKEDVIDWSNIPNNPFAAHEVHAVDVLIGMEHNQYNDGVLFINNLGFSTQTRTKEILDKLITSIPPKNNYVNQHIGIVLAINNSNLNRRIAPVSAGSEDWKKDFGMWVSPLYNSSKQEENSGVSGYKSKSQGIMFGADTVINDSYLVGLSYGQIFSKMTYRNLKAGDNTKSLMNIFSLYGSYNNTSSAWFTEGILSYANSRIKNCSNRLIYDGSIEVALGKYKSRAYSGQLVEGYNFYYDKNITFSPIAGVRYAGIRDKSYIEQNTNFQNLSVRDIKYNKFEGIVGLRGTVHKEYNNWLLIPSVHTYLDYTFKGKVPDVPVILDGMNTSIMTKHSKLSKTLLTIGGNLRVQHGKMDFSFRYDSFFAKKYHAYQVSINAKVHL